MPLGWTILIVALWLVVVALATTVIGLLRQLIPLVQQAGSGPAAGRATLFGGPPAGSRIPHFTAQTPDGYPADERHLLGSPTVIVFLSGSCGPCQQLAQQISNADLNGLLEQLVVVTDPSGHDDLALPDGLRLLIEPDRQVTRAFAVHGFPFAVAMDSAGTVRETLPVSTADQLASLARGLRAPEHAAG
jgi:hypothetical protein